VLGRPPVLTWPDPTPDGFPPTVTTGPYADALRGMITAHKEEQALLLTGLLGELLARSVGWLLRSAGAESVPGWLVPMPSAPAAVRQRGFDATGALARRAARRLRAGGVPVGVRRWLGYRRRVRDQAGLDAAARRENLAGALRVRPLAVTATGWVVLVDDVVTTGASLTAAAGTLRAAGVWVLGAATVAATQRNPRR
jgi:predicted amidophosphoribosyltransferase